MVEVFCSLVHYQMSTLHACSLVNLRLQMLSEPADTLQQRPTRIFAHKWPSLQELLERTATAT